MLTQTGYTNRQRITLNQGLDSVLTFNQLLTHKIILQNLNLALEILLTEIKDCLMGTPIVGQLLGSEQNNFLKFMTKARLLFKFFSELSPLLKKNSALWQEIQLIPSSNLMPVDETAALYFGAKEFFNVSQIQC